MKDMFDFQNDDIILKEEYSDGRVQGLLVKLGKYPYNPQIGIDYEFWINSKYALDLNSYQRYIQDYLTSYNVPVQKVEVNITGDGGILFENIIITLGKIQEINNGLR